MNILYYEGFDEAGAWGIINADEDNKTALPKLKAILNPSGLTLKECYKIAITKA